MIIVSFVFDKNLAEQQKRKQTKTKKAYPPGPGASFKQGFGFALLTNRIRIEKISMKMNSNDAKSRVISQQQQRKCTKQQKESL
jgi:hypothetical protein